VADQKARGRTKRGLEFLISYEGKRDAESEAVAYAFDGKGGLLAKATVELGVARLDLTDDQARGARIILGPDLAGKRSAEPTLDSLEHLGGYEPRFEFDAKVRQYTFDPIPEWILTSWPWCSCRVRGRVVRPVSVNGIVTDMPVCHARVHLCEVDPLYYLIPRLPDEIVLRIRDELLLAIRRPFPWPPPPDPAFRFDPGVIDPSPQNIAAMNNLVETRTALDPTAEFAVSNDLLTAEVARPGPSPFHGGEQLLAMDPAAVSGQVIDLDLTTRAYLTSGSTHVVRQGLLASIDLIRPYLCWWRWLWPYLYWCDEMAVVETDAQGSFDTTIWYSCFGDKPDLYFWAEFSIGGAWTTVYDPGIRCATYWDYACGTTVTIRISDPRVPWCAPLPTLPGLQVGVVTVGNNVSLHEIQGQAGGVAEGLTTDGRPFGASLEPHVWFSNDNLLAAGISHYRWSYRRLGSTGSWAAMDRQVVRHYAWIDAAGTLTFKPFVLGPDPTPAIASLNLFKIQPTAAPAGSYGWAPMVDARENSASAFLLSHLLSAGDPSAAAGKYELKLELFDSAGSTINWTDAGVLPKVPTIDGPFGPVTVPMVAPAAEHLLLDASGKTVGFRLVVHVDNNHCQAVIHPVSIAGSVMDPCGFMKYSPASLVHVSFLARHPNDFATFSFGTYRGSSGGVAAASASGSVHGPTINLFTRDAASEWAKNVPVADLLGQCVKAAFAETLYVAATATDGWSILTYLDAWGTPLAYALEP
jgi:hypothetical protein